MTHFQDFEGRVTTGNKIRNERKKMGLSLDEAATRTGVSKTMLGQIERGESSPTLSTMWKIASGLKLSVSTLLAPPEQDNYRVNNLHELEYMEDKDKKSKVFTVFPFNPLVPIDFLYAIQQPGAHYPSATHKTAKEEQIFVTKGVLTLHVGDEKFTLCERDSMSFRGDEDHIYENNGDQVCEFLTIVIY